MAKEQYYCYYAERTNGVQLKPCPKQCDECKEETNSKLTLNDMEEAKFYCQDGAECARDRCNPPQCVKCKSIDDRATDWFTRLKEE